MAKIKTFNDSSSVTVAYAITDSADKATVEAAKPAMKLVPFTKEAFQMQKEAKTSEAIRGDRRTSGSKNTKGSANGGVTVEFGAVGFVLDLLQVAMLSTWKDIDAGNPAAGKYITDDQLIQYLLVEKTTRQGALATDKQDHEWYFGTVINDLSMKFADGELITLETSTISANGDYASAVIGANGLGGSLASAKAKPIQYEIADSSNNLATIEMKSGTTVMEVTWSDATLQLQNNAREQSGLSRQFAAGVGVGLVAVTFSGEIYYVDQSLLDAHMKNGFVSIKLTISTAQGTFTIQMPNMKVGSPTNNAEGQNTDYTTAVTLTAEAGEVEIGAATVPCMIAIEYVPTP
jgi:hypothetical protein